MRFLGSSVALLLRNREFAALWAAELISTLGDRVHRVALAALVYHMTGSLTQTGIAFVATALPDLLLGPVVGVLVDRWDRRWAMVLCDLLRIPPVLLIPIVAEVHLWLVYVLLLLLNTLSIVFRPAKTAMIPSLVEQDELNRANSISSISENVSDVVGYPMAGALLAGATAWFGWEIGMVAAFAFDGVTYLASALLILRIRPRPVERVERALGSLWTELGDGIRFVRRNRVVRSNTLVMLFGPLTLGAVTPLLVGYAWDTLGGGEWEYAMLGTGISVGSILGGLWLSGLRGIQSGAIVLFGLAVMGIGVMATAAVSHLWVAVALLGVSGVGSMMVLIPSVTLVQSHTPDRMLGRVFSLRSTLIFAAIVISNALGGWAGQRFGVQASLFVCGALLVAFVAVAAAFPSVRRIDLPATASEGTPYLD